MKKYFCFIVPFGLFLSVLSCSNVETRTKDSRLHGVPISELHLVNGSIGEDSIFKDFDLLDRILKFQIRSRNTKYPYISVRKWKRFLIVTSHYTANDQRSRFFLPNGDDLIWADTTEELGDPHTSYLSIFVARKDFIGKLKYSGNRKPSYDWELSSGEIIYADFNRVEYIFKHKNGLRPFVMPGADEVFWKTPIRIEFQTNGFIEHFPPNLGFPNGYSTTYYYSGPTWRLPGPSLYWLYLERWTTTRVRWW